MNAKTKVKNGLEESLADLEKVVEMLESGDLGLDQSIKEFEKGIKIYKSCKKELEKAEKKIQVLTDSLSEEPLE